jgi:hypothetical protein
MVVEAKKMLEKAGPGTAQVNLGGLVTMAMVVISWTVVEYTAFKAPEFVWTAITGILLYAAQYWHGPKKSDL